MSVVPLTPKIINYLDTLPEDIISVIYDMVIISHTQDIDDAITRLEGDLVVINDLNFDNKYIKEQFITSRDNNGVEHYIYDNNYHINPNINLRQVFETRSINIQVRNNFNIRTYEGDNNLEGVVHNWLSLDITHTDTPHNTALIIDYAVRHMLSAPVSVYNRGWEYNVINSIMWDYDSDDEEDIIDGVLNFIIETTNRRWDGTIADNNPEHSRVATFE